ncbi:MAG: phosphatase PAP2 family protein [Bacteroidota bacterium]
MHSPLHDKLVYWDHVVWFYVNTQWHNRVLDVIMPFLRNQWTWSPLYLFLLLFMTSRFGKKGWFWCVAFLISFILSDQISATLIKPYIHRLRPCNNPALADIVHLLVPCGSGKSFPSSHATNHFSLAVFSSLTLGRYARWVWPVSLLWAFSVVYAQVYVGVHYPLDVICGGILGAVIGITTGTLFNRYIGLTPAAPTA